MGRTAWGWRQPLAATGSALVVAGLLTGCAGGGQASSTGLDDMEPLVLKAAAIAGPESGEGRALQAFADYVSEQTDEKITVEIYHSSVLLNGVNSLDGLGSGVADFGMIYPSLFSQELPNMAWATSVFATGREAHPHSMLAGSPAMNEAMLNDEAIVDEYRSHNLRLLGGFVPSSRYELMCKEPFESVEDLKGAANASSATGERFRS